VVVAPRRGQVFSARNRSVANQNGIEWCRWIAGFRRLRWSKGVESSLTSFHIPSRLAESIRSSDRESVFVWLASCASLLDVPGDPSSVVAPEPSITDSRFAPIESDDPPTDTENGAAKAVVDFGFLLLAHRPPAWADRAYFERRPSVCGGPMNP
jgi:hypothetical protein